MVRRSRADLIAAIEELVDLDDAPRTEKRWAELLLCTAEISCVGAPVKTAMHALQIKFAEKPGHHESVSAPAAGQCILGIGAAGPSWTKEADASQ